MSQSASIKHFLSSDNGAPTLTGAAGDMAALLYACLVTGYNVSAVDSITRDGTTVTVTVSAGHGLAIGSVVKIAGADQAEYNGDHRITTADATTFEYELEVAETPVSPATGTLECRQAPAGWERPFVSGDNLRAAFRSPNVEATGFYFYIDDTNNQGTRRCGIKGYESMTDIDTGINPFPYSAADDKWFWWYKSENETTAKRWAIIADDRWVYVWWNRASDNNGDYGKLNAFGDFNSYVPADAYNFLVTGAWSNSSEEYQSMLATGAALYSSGASLITSGAEIARDYQGTAPGRLYGCAAAVSPYNYSGYVYGRTLGYSGGAFPDPVSGGAVISPVDFWEICGGSQLLRGRQPGLYNPLHARPYNHVEPTLVSGSGDFADRRFMALPFRGGRFDVSSGQEINKITTGQALIDISGPWW